MPCTSQCDIVRSRFASVEVHASSNVFQYMAVPCSFACGLIEHLSHRPKVAAKEFKARLDELMGLLQQAGLADHNCRQAYKIRWRPILSDVRPQHL